MAIFLIISVDWLAEYEKATKMKMKEILVKNE